MSEVWRTLAPAKLNLVLEVLGRRDDGYHEIASIAATIDLADRLELRRGAREAGDVTIVDENGRPQAIPFGEELIGRAWQRLREAAPDRVDRRATVRVEKRIPIAGGLGGGSSDAAAFLRLARAAWDLPAPLVRAVAASVGSDVSLFLDGGTVSMQGRGERVTPLPDADGWLALLYTPELPIPADKTAAMYRALRPAHFSDGARCAGLRAALAARAPLDPDACRNTFDRVADEVLTGLHDGRRRLGVASQRVPLLAGAGPSLFVLGAATDAGAFAAAAATLRGEGLARARVVHPLDRDAATRVEPLREG